MKLAGTDLRLLRVFDSVVRHAGFGAAQAELNISQSTISNHITALEQRLGVKLCQRGRAGFRLTEKGEIVYAAAQNLLRSIDDFSSEVGELKGGLSGELKIGLVDSIATDPQSQFHNAVARFQRQDNAVQLTLQQGTPQHLQEQVLDGALHFAIGSFPHKVFGLDYDWLYDEDHSLYCAHGHPWFEKAGKKTIGRKALKDLAIVSRGYWSERFSRQFGFENIAATVYQIEPQLLLILSGCYVGFLPDHYAAHWVQQGQLRAINPGKISFTCPFELVTRKGYRKTQVIETFLAELKTAYGK